jgi:N-acetylneuraminic acid mutarotase
VGGIIYAIGGASKVRYSLTTVEAYDPLTNTWTKKADMPTARFFLSTSVVNGKIYAIGGSFSGPNDILSIVEEYDPATDSWIKKTDMPIARFGSATSVANGKIYVLGGAVGYDALQEVEEYDPANNTWTTRTSMPTARAALSACTVEGRVYAIGGFLTVKPPHPAVATVEVYAPSK